MLTFTKPLSLNGAALVDELRAAGYQIDALGLSVSGDELTVSALTQSGTAIDERSRSSIQAILDAHTGAPSVAQSRESAVLAKIATALDTIRTELANWPTDLTAGATLQQVGQRVNQLMAQERRNTQRLEKVAQLLLRRFDVPEE